MIDKLVRPQIKQMEEINWGDIPENEGMRLLWGENPIVIKEAVDAARKEADKLNYYPSPTKSQLKEKLAEYNNVPPENIVPTNGSDEALELIGKVFLAEGDEVIMPIPSYPCFESVSAMMGATVKKILLNSDFSLNIERLLKAITTKTKIIWIANPNNPTGNIVALCDQLENIARRVSALVVIDECYFELAGETAADLVWQYPNVVIVRSFSKVFALAGVRLGYIIADQKVNFYLNRLQQSNQVFNVNRFAQAAGIALLKDKSVIEKSIRDFQMLKRKFEDELQQINGLEVLSTKTTFCLLKIKKKGIKSSELKNELQKKNIFIKDCSIYKGLEDEYIYLGVSQEKFRLKIVRAIQQVLL